MSYRSEVAIKCEEEAYKMLKKTCQKMDIMPNKIFKDGDEYILHWDCIKWHEDCEDVSAIIKTLDKLDELQDPDDYKTTGYGYKFIRLCEEDEDVKIRRNDWNIELCMICRIDIPDWLEEIEE